MRRFAQLYETLDRTTSTNAKVAAMAAYFRDAPPGDAAWALFFLTQRKIKRLLPTRVLWDLTLDLTGIPEWLLEHSYAAVGDGAEPYRSGRRRGDWWKWKIAPYTVDAVLMYAHPGHGRRATLFTDYTFGVWKQGELVPVAKAYSGLSDQEVHELDAWIRRHTRERFGPVRVVEPSQVFELAFEGIARSTRHKSGLAVRFPRILRHRTDKPAAEADTIETVLALLRPAR